MGTLHFAVNVRFSHLMATPGDWLLARLVFYFLTLAPRDYVTYCQARGLAMGVWPSVSTRQDIGHTLRGGPAHKIKAFTTLIDVHRKILYSTKYATFLVTLPLHSI